ncbi:DUF6151 family protein [Roseibium sp. MB-4]
MPTEYSAQAQPVADVNLSCSCGVVQGTLTVSRRASVPRYVCYCTDCQAFVRHLRANELVFDQASGSEVIHLEPAALKISKGLEHLRCLDLCGRGTLRWYTVCCSTPIGSTLSSGGFPFVSLLTSFCCESSEPTPFGEVRGRVGIRNATALLPGEKVKTVTAFRMLFGVAWIMVRARLFGRHKPFVFFPEGGSRPIASPGRLTKHQRATAYGLSGRCCNGT